MKQLTNYDDDNLSQVAEDSFVVIDDGHDLDTIIDGKHVIVDTIRKTDTLIIEKVTYDKEIQIIERIMQKPDAGKSVVSVLILIFCIYSIWKKWNHKNKND